MVTQQSFEETQELDERQLFEWLQEWVKQASDEELQIAIKLLENQITRLA